MGKANNKWKLMAEKIVLEFEEAGTGSGRIQYLEYLADKGTDLAVWEEILNLAVKGKARDE